jgi:hypothetical protein
LAVININTVLTAQFHEKIDTERGKILALSNIFDQYGVLNSAFCYFFIRLMLMEKVTGGVFAPTR